MPGETSEPQPTITPDVGVKPEATAVPSQVPGDNGTEAEKTSAAVQQQIKKSSPEINKAAVISTEGADRPGKKLTLFGVKTQKQKPGKVRFKKTGYRGGKIRLVWGKSKNAKGYQIVFMKRKKGKIIPDMEWCRKMLCENPSIPNTGEKTNIWIVECL